MHRCSKYCRRKRKFENSYITRCRFGCPRVVSKTALLRQVDDCLKVRDKIYVLPQADTETRVNDYNPLLLLLWKANMDIQSIAENSLAHAHYVRHRIRNESREKQPSRSLARSGIEQEYIQSTMELWRSQFAVSGMWLIRSYFDIYIYILLGDHFCGKSETVKWMDVSVPHKRTRRLKDHKKLQELKGQDPKSTEIFENSLTDVCYPKKQTSAPK